MAGKNLDTGNLDGARQKGKQNFFIFPTGFNNGIEFLGMCQVQILCSIFLKISHLGKQSYLYRMSKTH